MKKICLALALAGGVIIPINTRAQFADAVVSYNSGTGFATGFTNSSAALGAPASGNAITPFAPPFSKTQIVSIGAGGEITLQLSAPIVDDPNDPYGIGFNIFANQFFIENSSDEVSGLSYHADSIAVQVSQDDSTWYTLDSSLAPQPGTLYPTYGNGNPLIPVNPALTQADFNGQTLAGVESLYGGSAGGTGYDLEWATNASGASEDLASADYVRIEVQTGVLDLDAISVMAAPDRMLTSWMLLAVGAGLFWFHSRMPKKLRGGLVLAGLMAFSSGHAATLTEGFSSDPLQNGWQIFGDTNLFQWDSTNQVLDVTWDSSQSNSYFYHPLGTVLTVDNDFSIEFDLQLSSAVATGENGFQLGLGLFNFSDATNASFSRPLGVTPNIFEFDYYPDVGYGPTVAGTLTDMNESAVNWYYFYYIYDILPMDNGVDYHVILTHEAGETNLSGEVLTDGEIYSTFSGVYADYVTNFQIDTVSISSYSDAGDTYGDTIFAQGTVANLLVTWAPPPIRNVSGAFSNGVWQVQFCSQSNWLYTLQRTASFQCWTNVSPPTPGNATNMFLEDTTRPGEKAFYRVSASAP